MLIHRNKKLRIKRVNPFIVYLIALFLAVGGFLLWRNIEKATSQQRIELVPGDFPKKVIKTEDVKPKEEVVVPTETDSAASAYPILLTADQASSLTVVVNKKHKLPSEYAPSLSSVRGASLRDEAATALENLLSSAEGFGYGVKIVSAYRSYNTQTNTYNGYVAQYGQATADTFSARPGHSEHQTGLSVDVGNANGHCELEICFGSTNFGEWLKNNAPSYGFIIRYPEGKESATGYQYEPWHLRYVGQDNAALIFYSGGKTMDEYYGVVAGDY